MGPLIDVLELDQRLVDVRVCDVRWSLTDPRRGREAYKTGHIPGAVFVDLDVDLSAPPRRGRHPLPEVEDFAATLGRLGIAPTTEVVVYDDVGGVVAARMWWMLRSIGHRDVHLLDGGYQAWVDGGLPVETGDVVPEAAHYPPPDGFTGVVEIDAIGDRPLLDVRAPERYMGEVEPVDPVPGHIPGAVNLPVGGNLGQDGRFREAAYLEQRYRDYAGTAVVSCGSGVNACHAALAMEVAGLPLPDVYIGSYSEWSRSGRPVATGADP